MKSLNSLLALAVFISFNVLASQGFVLPLQRHRPAAAGSLTCGTKVDNGVETNSLEAIRGMRIKEIKEELRSLKVKTDGIFEKEELVQRLYEASTNNSLSDGRREPSNSSSASPASQTVTETPLYFVTLEREVKVAAVNLPDGQGVTLQPGQQLFPTIQVELYPPHSNDQPILLTMLLDTACTGIVLRPEVVNKYGLPSLSTPVTMTGAGGTASQTGLTELHQFSVGGTRFGRMPAAVQAIDALPSAFDGIMGLSFLSQFEAVELDFQQGVLRLFHDKASSSSSSSSSNSSSGDLKVVAECDMTMVPSLGIYTVDVRFGGRGPVKLLVDTGSDSTLLNWRGVADLGLSKSSPQVSQSRDAWGALGSDSRAIALTHRINVSSKMELGQRTARKNPGLSLEGASRLAIDIGDIPILDALSSQGVGGILGCDALMRAAKIRLRCRGNPHLTLLM